MESASTNLRSILEDEGEEEDIGPSTVGSDKTPWKQESRSIEEMEDKENIPKYPEHISDFSVSDKKASLSVKRTKKKGFNLRKSLAWNPAFFTEEGVLDSVELSYICGSIGESHRSTKSSNRQAINEAVKNSEGKSQMRSNLRRHAGRKMFTTPEPTIRQEKKASEVSRKLKQSEPATRTLLRPPATSQQKRVASTSATGSVTKAQKSLQESTTPTSRVPNNQENVAKSAVISNGPRSIQLIQEKDPIFMAKSSTGAESSATPQMHSQTIPRATMHAPLDIKPSGLRKPSPSYGFFAEGHVAAQSTCSLQKNPEKNSICIPSTLLKPPPYKWRPPVVHDTAKKFTEGALPQSKVPQRIRFDRPSANTTGKKQIEKPTRTSVKPREKMVARQLACSKFSSKASSIKILDTSICKSKDTSSAEKSSIVSVEVKEPAVNHLTCSLLSSKACDPMDAHGTLTEPSNVVSLDDGLMKNHNGTSKRDFVEAEEQHDAQFISNTILDESRSSIDVKSVVGKQNDTGSDVSINGVKHMEEGSRICGKGGTAVTLFGQNCISPESYSLMDVDVVSKSNDLDLRVVANGMNQTLCSNLICEGRKEETVVAPLACNHILSETYYSKNKHTTKPNQSVNGPAQDGTAKVSVSPARTQRVNTDFLPCKEKPLEKRFKLDSGPSLAVREKDILVDDKPEGGKMEKKSAERSEGKVNPKFQKDLVPFSEEWLAALEAYGEDILVKKTGPVQNSPPDKTKPEPSPWSPVKKKTQDIGPYDCTKYSKTVSSSDSQ